MGILGYVVNLLFYGLFIGLIFGLKINTKKTLPGCIGFSIGSIFIQMVAEWILGCVSYLFFDDSVMTAVVFYLETFATVSFMVLTVWIISIIAGCAKKNKYIVLISLAILFITIFIQSVYIKLTQEMVDNLNIVDSLFNEVLENYELQREIGIVSSVRRVFERIPAVIYMVYVILKSKLK